MVPSDGMNTYRQTLLGQLDRRFLGRGPVLAALGVLLVATLVVPSVQFVLRIQEVDTSLFRAGGERHRTALGRWLPDAEALTKVDEGEEPYGYGHWFPTPPFVLMCLIPLWKMGYTSAGVAWATMKVVGFVWAMWSLIRAMGMKGPAVPAGVLVMTAAFGMRPIISDLQHGNLNIFMMIWLAFAWTLYMRQRDVWAGIFVALAIVTKITPALVLIYFVYQRAWRVVAGAAAGLVLFFVVLPGLYLGFGQNLALLKAWFDMLVAPFVVEGYGTVAIENQSLGGVCVRLLSNAGILAIEHLPTDLEMQAGMAAEDMARPVAAWGRLLRPCLSLAMVGALAWLCRGPSTVRRDLRAWLEFGLVLLAMLLLSERTWKHHATTLPIIYLGVWYALTCVAWSNRFRAWFVAGLGAQFFLLVASGEGVFGDEVAELLLDGGVFCWGLLLCFIQTAVLRRGLGRRSVSLPGGCL